MLLKELQVVVLFQMWQQEKDWFASSLVYLTLSISCVIADFDLGPGSVFLQTRNASAMAAMLSGGKAA